MDFSLLSCPIRSFQSVMQSATALAESLPKEDLYIALKSSISLMDKIVDLMQSCGSNINPVNNSNNVDISACLSTNSFLNSFPQSKPDQVGLNFQNISTTNLRHQPDSFLFSNRLSFPSTETISSSCILPASSSETLAVLNGFMKNGIMSNNESFLSNYQQHQQHLTQFQHQDAEESQHQHNSNNNSHDGCRLSKSPADEIPKLEMTSLSDQGAWKMNTEVSPTSSCYSYDGVAPAGGRAQTAPGISVDDCRPEEEPEESSVARYNSWGHGGGGLHQRRGAVNYSSDELNKLLDSCEVPGLVIDGKKNYRCKFCGKMYEIKSSIRYHIRIIHLKMHLKTADMRCKLCGRVFTCATAANKHQMRCLNKTAAATTAVAAAASTATTLQ